jgi:hypothetical protein
MAKMKQPDKGKKVRRLARALVGPPPASRILEPKLLRKKPKHKRPLTEDTDG